MSAQFDQIGRSSLFVIINFSYVMRIPTRLVAVLIVLCSREHILFCIYSGEQIAKIKIGKWDYVAYDNIIWNLLLLNSSLVSITSLLKLSVTAPDLNYHILSNASKSKI